MFADTHTHTHNLPLSREEEKEEEKMAGGGPSRLLFFLGLPQQQLKHDLSQSERFPKVRLNQGRREWGLRIVLSGR